MKAKSLLLTVPLAVSALTFTSSGRRSVLGLAALRQVPGDRLRSPDTGIADCIAAVVARGRYGVDGNSDWNARGDGNDRASRHSGETDSGKETSNNGEG